MTESAIYIAIVTLVILAGCSTSPDTPESIEVIHRTTVVPTEESVKIPVQGNSRLVDANRTFARVQDLMNSTVEPPRRVTFESGANASQFRFSYGSHPFLELLGAGSSNLNSTVAGRADGESVRMFYTDDATDEQIEHVLAHEFAHVVQYRTGLRDTAMAKFEDDYSQTTDGRMARKSVIEGSAEYIATEYDREYLSEARPNETVLWDRQSESLSSALYWAPYRYGARYVDQRIDSPRQIEIVHRSPPRTTEQVLHGYVPEEEPPKPLNVRSNDSNSNWGLTIRDTVGEFTIRLTLASELDESPAARGAAGWGNDEVLTYYNGSSTGSAWVTRWDDPANASAFEQTFERYLSERATAHDDTWRDGQYSFRMERSHDDTVVVFVGAESFVRNATLDTDERDVIVVPPRR